MFFYKGVDDFSAFLRELKEVNYVYILLASLLLYISVWFRAIRWKILLDRECNIYDLFKIQMVGYFANNILPFRIGELLKSFLVSENQKISKSYALGTIVMERFLDMVILLLLMLLCILISPIDNIAINENVYSLHSLLLIILLVVFSFLFLFVSISKGLIKIKLFQNFLDKFIIAYENFSVSQFTYSSLFGVAIWAIHWAQIDLVFRAFSIVASPYQSLLILIIGSLVVSIPSLPGAIGTFHVVVYSTLNVFGIDVEGSSFTMILHAYGYISLTVIGFYYFIIDKNIGVKQLIDFKKLKK